MQIRCLAEVIGNVRDIPSQCVVREVMLTLFTEDVYQITPVMMNVYLRLFRLLMVCYERINLGLSTFWFSCYKGEVTTWNVHISYHIYSRLVGKGVITKKVGYGHSLIQLRKDKIISDVAYMWTNFRIILNLSCFCMSLYMKLKFIQL